VVRRTGWIRQQMDQLGGPAYIEGHAPAHPAH